MHRSLCHHAKPYPHGSPNVNHTQLHATSAALHKVNERRRDTNETVHDLINKIKFRYLGIQKKTSFTFRYSQGIVPNRCIWKAMWDSHIRQIFSTLGKRFPHFQTIGLEVFKFTPNTAKTREGN